MTEPDYTPDVVARNVKPLGNGVIEIIRYKDDFYKSNGLGCIWLSLLAHWDKKFHKVNMEDLKMICSIFIG